MKLLRSIREKLLVRRNNTKPQTRLDNEYRVLLNIEGKCPEEVGSGLAFWFLSGLVDASSSPRHANSRSLRMRASPGHVHRDAHGTNRRWWLREYFPTLTSRRFVPSSLVSLVSVLGGNWRYLCGRIERIETSEIVEMANIHAVFMHLPENMVGCSKRLGEYPTIRSSLI